MKLVAISDIHISDAHQKREIDLPEGDLLIVAGDLTSTGTPAQLVAFNNYLEKHKSKYNYKPLVIAGNHDFALEQNPDEAIDILTAADYIEDALVEIGGVRIWGSPWTPTFFDWAFMKDRGSEIREMWEMIPENLDVLVTHGPPWGILDFCGSHAGCSDLLDIVTTKLTTAPRFHIFGHIHEGFGSHETEKTQFLNVSVCDEHYHAVNKPTVIEL